MYSQQRLADTFYFLSRLSFSFCCFSKVPLDSFEPLALAALKLGLPTWSCLRLASPFWCFSREEGLFCELCPPFVICQRVIKQPRQTRKQKTRPG